jgi:hypothetical protein
MILFDDIIELFDLADNDRCTVVFIIAADSGGISLTAIIRMMSCGKWAPLRLTVIVALPLVLP